MLLLGHALGAVWVVLLDCSLHHSSCKGELSKVGKVGGISLTTVDLLKKADLF